MSPTGIAANRLELLQIADAVAREKSIDREVVIAAIEEAIQKGARARYGAEHDIRVRIDPKTGETTLKRVIRVIPDDETFTDEDGLPVEPVGIRRLSEALRDDPEAFVGKTYEEVLPPFEFGRVQTQMARQVVTGKVREAERERQYEEFKDRVGEVINGVVKRVEYGNTVVDLGRGEGIMRRDQSIPRENFNIGDRIRCYIYDVRREAKGPQILLSRAHGGFMAKLFAQEVPEVYDGVIEIRAVARDPGSRAKMAVISNDSSIDPVGACVGMRGSRVQAVVAELQGEKIDIIQWSPDEATFIVNALAPAEVSKVVMDEEDERVEVVVPDEQLSLAIGRRGQNVRLASQLTGWQIDIMTESQESERRQREFAERTALFQEALDVDEVIAQLLVTEGFATVEDVAYVDSSEVAAIEGFDEDTAEEIQARARDHLEREAAELDARRRELGVEDGLLEIEGVTLPVAVALGEGEVKSVEDLAGLVPDDLRGWYETRNGERVREPGVLESFGLDAADAEALILRARIAMGWIEAPPEAVEEEIEAELSEEDIVFGQPGAREA
ncbi:MAG: transcription termination/antitermination protein NusA [Phenylobacterium sp.]|jgi:N utilization substance protein A|uniref:transcription termination factor NusA n=1 Tax=Phenylobacterium sp. TaxID=1871053 RepID=UPI0025F38F82|nr:transcription termination factor NusA [Phenylobacterium sp.]MCA3712988.1 transcription termination/antitermination protein NusA [Phenylobacterium sp.]MCA3714272.1 transcription termination/antitermination protein NusA [Phenylobacterium sp.]MCA3723939.1 transcription termination/antitermination protein NusA [Phenylobacterium sp.]MCA3727777.1 transcription termination/antitermination protein NusA [Phenylobacterium sp.]MCA3730178.1 transcription termination/antitermination protein NusA [Phenyl